MRLGDLRDWLGEVDELVPDYGRAIQVVPDDQHATVDEQRYWIELIGETLRRAIVPPKEDVLEDPASEERSFEAALSSGLTETDGHVAAFERLLEEVRAELGGEDPLHPELRDLVTRIRADLERLITDATEVLAITVERRTQDDEWSAALNGVMDALAPSE